MSDADLRETTTPNLNLNLPDVGGDWDQWGDETNSNWRYIDANMLPVFGGTMTGLLTLYGPPTTANGAATKSYVDATAAAAGVTSFNTRQGAVTLNSADIAGASGLLTTGGTVTGKLTVITPVAANDAATKAYVDTTAAAAGVTSFNTRQGAVTLNSADIAGAGGLLAAGGTVTGGINFGSVLDSGPSSAANHIWLFGTQYGLGVTSTRLNLIGGAGGSVVANIGGSDVLSVNSGAALKLGTTAQNSLTITPGAAAGSQATVALSGTGGLAMPNTSYAAGLAITFSLVGSTIGSGTNGASISTANIEIGAANAIGIMGGGAGQRVPQGLNAIWFSTRFGTVTSLGQFNSYVSSSATNSFFGALAIRRQANDQQIYLDGNVAWPSLTSATPVAGGSGVNVNDRYYDAYNNCYTVTAASGGAATTIQMDQASVWPTGVWPTNPIPLTAAPGFVGTGITVNLTWTQPNRLLLQTNVTGSTLAFGAPGGLTFLNGATISAGLGSANTDFSRGIAYYSTTFGVGVTSNRLNYGVPSGAAHVFLVGANDVLNLGATSITVQGGVSLMLPADPTVALGAATKQYVDNKVTASIGGVASFNTRTGAVSLLLADVTSVGGAPLASPVFTGTPAGPTPTAGDNSTQLATTAFVGNAVASLPIPAASNTTPAMDGTATVGTGTTWARADHVHPTDTSRYAASNPNGYQTAAQVIATVNNYLPLAGGTLSGGLSIDAGGLGVSGGAVNIWTSVTIYNNVSAYGYGTRDGTTGANGGHNFNISYPNGPGPACWIDGTNFGTFAFVSDYRIKRHVAPLGSMWQRIKTLRPISYTQRDYTPSGADRPLFTADDTERWGFVAHELQETLLQSAASGNKDQTDCLQSPNPLTLLAVVTRALQEAIARIEALEARAA